MLTWLVNFRRSGGSDLVRLARLNGEVLHSPHADGVPVSPDGKDLKPWDLTRQGLGGFVDRLVQSHVSFASSEWGVPDQEYLATRADVRVITVIRDPISRLLSNFNYDYIHGISPADSVLDYVDRHLRPHSLSNYYVRLLAGREWHLDAEPSDMVALARYRLSLMDHVAIYEQSASWRELADALAWRRLPPALPGVEVAGTRDPGRRASLLLRGRFDLIPRMTPPAPPSSEVLAELRRRNRMDVELYSMLSARSPRAGSA